VGDPPLKIHFQGGSVATVNSAPFVATGHILIRHSKQNRDVPTNHFYTNGGCGGQHRKRMAGIRKMGCEKAAAGTK